jgi:tetratricopeptide (TPR) repeat protein
MKTAALAWAVFAVAFRPVLRCEQHPAVDELAAIQGLIQRGNLAEASARIVTDLQTYPRESAFYNFRGVIEAQQGRYAEAEAAFLRAVEISPRFTGAYLNLGRLYQEKSARDPRMPGSQKAIRTYEQVLLFDPANAEAHYQLALLLLLRDSAQASLAHLAELPAGAGEHSQALALRCAAEAALGRPAQAKATAQKLLNSPELAEADVTTILPALAAHHLTDLEVQLIEGLAARRLSSGQALHRLALLYEDAGRLKEARSTLETVGSQQAPDVPLLLDLARVAYKQRDHEGALGYLAHARDLEPRNPGIHFFIGVVLIEMDLPFEAEKSLSRAAELDPRNASVAYSLGAVNSQMQKWNQATLWFERYCALKPEDPHGKLALGSAYFASMADDKARKELESIVTESGTAAGAHYYLGRMAARANDFDAATKELRQAVALSPQYAEAWAELGFTYLQQEEYAEARQALERSLALDPNSFRTNLSLLTLYQRTGDPHAEAQADRVGKLDKKRSEKASAMLRTIHVQPY